MKQIEREFISRRKQGKTEKAKEEKRDMKKNRKKNTTWYILTEFVVYSCTIESSG